MSEVHRTVLFVLVLVAQHLVYILRLLHCESNAIFTAEALSRT